MGHNYASGSLMVVMIDEYYSEQYNRQHDIYFVGKILEGLIIFTINIATALFFAF
jgi:hypothetical protein